jgi:hypothetical protein
LLHVREISRNFDQFLERGWAERQELDDRHLQRCGDAYERCERRDDHTALKLRNVPSPKACFFDKRVERVVPLRTQPLYSFAQGDRNGHCLLSMRVGRTSDAGARPNFRHGTPRRLGVRRLRVVRIFEHKAAR